MSDPKLRFAPTLAGLVVSSKAGTFLESAALPRAFGDVLRANIVLAPKSSEGDKFLITTITSVEIDMNEGTITLGLAATAYRGVAYPFLRYYNGTWALWHRDVALDNGRYVRESVAYQDMEILVLK